MSPRRLISVFLAEEGISYHQLVFCTFGQELNPIGITIAYPVLPNDIFPHREIYPCPSIEVTRLSLQSWYICGDCYRLVIGF